MLDYNLTVREAKVLCAVSPHGPTSYYELAVSTGSLEDGTEIQTFLTRLINKGLVKQSERGRFFELSEDGRAVQVLIGRSPLRTFYKSNRYSVLIVPNEIEQPTSEPEGRRGRSGLETEAKGGRHAGGSAEATRDGGRLDDRGGEDSDRRATSNKAEAETDWDHVRSGGPDADRDAAIEREISKMEGEPSEGSRGADDRGGGRDR